MKLKEKIYHIGSFVLLSVLSVVFLPILLLCVLFRLILMPYYYIKYRRSRYQQDFPQRFGFWSTPHADNEPYTAIRPNDLPIEYIKLQEQYECHGYFLYRNYLLVFYEPLDFDQEKNQWFLWIGDGESDGEENGQKTVGADDRLSVEEAKAFFLDVFRSSVPERTCNQIVFFYQRKRAERQNGKNGLDAMKMHDCFFLYEKGELAETMQKFIDMH